MYIRLCLVISVLSALTHFSNPARTEFSIGEICDNLAAFFNLINPILNIEIQLDFKKAERFLHGRGSLALSSEIIINDCNAYKRDSEIFIIASVVNSFVVMFTERPWVHVENGLFNITAKRINLTGKMAEVRFRSVVLVDVDKAHVRNKYLDKGFIGPLIDGISIALSEYASKEIYFFGPNNQVSESKAIDAFSSAFQGYMYRLL